MQNSISLIKTMPGVKEIYPCGPLSVVVVFNPEEPINSDKTIKTIPNEQN